MLQNNVCLYLDVTSHSSKRGGFINCHFVGLYTISKIITIIQNWFYFIDSNKGAWNANTFKLQYIVFNIHSSAIFYHIFRAVPFKSMGAGQGRIGHLMYGGGGEKNIVAVQWLDQDFSGGGGTVPLLLMREEWHTTVLEWDLPEGTVTYNSTWVRPSSRESDIQQYMSETFQRGEWHTTVFEWDLPEGTVTYNSTWVRPSRGESDIQQYLGETFQYMRGEWHTIVFEWDLPEGRVIYNKQQ